MPTKKQLADGLRGRLAGVAERGRVLGRVLRARADVAAARRRLRAAFRELGEEVYGRLAEGRLEGDHGLLVHKERIDGLRGDVRRREEELRGAMQGPRPPAPDPDAAPAAVDGDPERGP